MTTSFHGELLLSRCNWWTMESAVKKGKAISLASFICWPKDITETFEFEKNSSGTKIIRAVCKLCQKHSETIVAICHGRIAQDVKTYGCDGTVHLLLPNLKRHVGSKCHGKALDLENKPRTLPKNQTTLDKSFTTGLEAAIQKCITLLNVAWYVADNERPFTDFPKLCELMSENGVSISGSYTDDQCARAFIHLLANEMSQEVKKSVNNANFVSFLIDGSTVYKKRISHEGELFYVRTAHQLVAKIELFDFLSMKDYVSVNAQNLTHALTVGLLHLFGDNPSSWKSCQHVDDCDCELVQIPTSDIPTTKLGEALKSHENKLIGGSADGAAVNFGSRKGLMTQMKNKIPWFLAIHCLSHRLELAIADAIKDTKFNEIDEFLYSLFLHFRNSPKEWTGMLAAAENLGCRVIQPPKSSGTRFISFRCRALEALITNWAVLVSYFSNQASSPDDDGEKAKGFLKKLLDGLFLGRCYAYMDILQVATETSCEIQDSKTMNIAHALTELGSMKVKMQELEISAGDYEEEILTKFQDAPQATNQVHVAAVTRSDSLRAGGDHVPVQRDVFLPVKKPELVKKRNKGEIIKDVCDTKLCTEPVPVKNCLSAITSIPVERSEAASKIITATESRFEEFEDHENVLSNLMWIHVSSWPVSNTRQPSTQEVKNIREFQNTDFLAIADHYDVPLKAASDGFSKQKALKQFQALKLKRAISPALQNMDDDAFWPYVYKTESDKRDLFLVVELVLSLPFSEAVVERGFSAKSRIVSDWRCSLSHATITDLLHFSTRKGDCHNMTKHRIVKQAADAFVRGTGSIPGTGLCTRRIKKLCCGICDDIESISSATNDDDVVAEDLNVDLDDDGDDGNEIDENHGFDEDDNRLTS